MKWEKICVIALFMLVGATIGQLLSMPGEFRGGVYTKLQDIENELALARRWYERSEYRTFLYVQLFNDNLPEEGFNCIRDYLENDKWDPYCAKDWYPQIKEHDYVYFGADPEQL